MTPREALERARGRRPLLPRAEIEARLSDEIAESVAYLESGRALSDLARDPYWPKWDSPWWHMVLLHELGLFDRIPRAIAHAMARAIDTEFLHEFPFRIEEVPPGGDPFRCIICHCALGTMLRLLADCGVDVDEALPWARAWFLRYRLPDGGLNCDEGAYLRPIPRSSFVSTLPPAEALLFAKPGGGSSAEREFLAGVAAYLEKRSLARSLSRGRVADPSWLVPAFPRFYFYDALRGLRFLAHWAASTRTKLEPAALAEPIGALDRWFALPATKRIPRRPESATGSYGPDADGTWRRSPHADTFPLLDRVGPSGIAAALLEREWLETLELLV